MEREWRDRGLGGGEREVWGKRGIGVESGGTSVREGSEKKERRRGKEKGGVSPSRFRGFMLHLLGHCGDYPECFAAQAS